ncbi:hypothetical protein Q0590_02710 [Rhodocytophaga aerolata]|uniref:YfhO family protein n=1 Tax=Rhodocytophaga aerolata TaxID=455078 RepID=A0ABT8QZ67_9BACT|nr:hypothetical protein [Rhodocytophaga aerolata]MDO1445141.1 hypothetical protein [Rhodocytophaga aerolata]
MYARIGFEVSYADINNISGISLLILLAPSIWNTFANLYLYKYRQPGGIGYSAIITLFTIVLLILCSYIVAFTGYWLVSVLAVFGYIFLLIALYLFFSKTGFTQWIAVLFFSLLMLIWLSGRIYSSVHTPLFLENLAIGMAKMDTLYNSSIMQMLKTYNISSTGLDGTPYLAYHWGSHWILSRFSTLLDTTAVTTYNLVYPAIFICLYFKASLTLGVDIFRQFIKSEKTLPKTGFIFWFTFLLVQIGFMPYSFLYNWAIWDSWIESESYALSLIFFLTFCSIALWMYNYVLKSSPTYSKLLLLFIPVAIPLLGILKISVLVIALSAFLYVFLKLQLFRNISYILISGVTIGLSYFVLQLTATTYTGEENNNFYLFHFLKSQMISNWKGLFYYMHYFWTILYIVLRCTKFQEFNVSTIKEAFFSNKFIDIELLVIISLIGLLPASVFRIDGGSAFYFTDIQARLACSFLMAYVLVDSFEMNSSEKTQKLIHYFRKYALLFPLVVFLLLSNIFSSFEKAINMNLASRIQFASLYSGPKGFLEGATADILHYTSGKKSDVYYKLRQLKYIPPAGLEENARYTFLKSLNQLDKLPTEKKHSLAIHIPKKHEWFWNQSLENIYATPFIIPSLTGIASAGGLPSSVDAYHFLNYGYHTYKANLNNAIYKPIDEGNFCRYINEREIFAKTILFINPESFSIDSLACSN